MDTPEFDDLFFSNENGLTVRRSPGDDVPFAVFEGVMPTPQQVQEVVARGYGVHFLGSGSDLRFLIEFENLRHLSITGTDLDTRVVSRLRELESLNLMTTGSPVTDLSGLADLHTYFGLLRGFESVLSAPRIEVAELHEVSDGSFSSVPRQLRKLTLHSARRIGNLTPVAGVEEPDLRYLHLHGARHFDVGSLGAFPKLETLVLEGIADVEAVASLRELRQLKLLSIMNCRAADGIASLAEAHGLEVLIVGKLARAVRGLVDQADPPWKIFNSL